MSERLDKIFKSPTPKTKLVSYFVGCYPTPEISLELIKEAIDNGVSILEIGYCTSEASAEGPIIKAAHDHVLSNGHNLNDIIKLVKDIRDYNQEVGIVLMGYIANLYKYPISNFVDDIKEAGGDADRVSQLRQELGNEFIILSGDDALTLPFMSVGAQGVISVASNLIPERISAMVNYFANGQIADALSIHQQYYQLFKALFIETNPVPVKEALHMMGHIEGEIRLPLVSMTDSNLQQLRSVINAYGLI